MARTNACPACAFVALSMLCCAWLQVASGRGLINSPGRHGRLHPRAKAGTSAGPPAGHTFPGDYIIVTNVRQEDDFIVEWLNYHLWIGFEHVAIYCNEEREEDAEALSAKLSAYVSRKLVTVIHWPAIGDQVGAFADFTAKYQREGQRVLLTDVDEFLVLCWHATVGELLQAMKARPEQCIHFPYLLFGTSHIAVHPKGSPVMTTYHLRQRRVYQNNGPWRQGKILIRSPMQLIPDAKPSMHHDCSQWQNHTTHSTREGTARLHHYSLRGGTLEAFRRRNDRGWGHVFRRAAKRYSPTKDVRVDYESRNQVSDPTMLSIMSEYPDLMLPRPPLQTRTVRTKCQKPVEWQAPPPKLQT